MGGGGEPSVALMRHADTRIDPYTKARYRGFLKSELKDLKFPTAEEERADRSRADAAYESVTAWLLTRTRDTQKFGLLFRENISYGFRRNLWGLKQIGLAIALGASISSATIAYRLWAVGATPSVEVAILTAIAWMLAVFWIVVVTSSWVRIPADAYGTQLLAACDTLSNSRNTKGSRTKS